MSVPITDPKGLVVQVLGGIVAIAVMGALAMVSESPFVFPSLGPTCLLLLKDPRARDSRPRVFVLGHLCGLVAGLGALVVTGLYLEPSAFASGVDASRSLAAGLSVGGTALLMGLTSSFHAPAAATTLIVSLGLIQRPRDLAIMLAAVLILGLLSLLVARSFGAKDECPEKEA